MSLDYLVNPNNPAIPAYTQYTANLPPIENLPPVYDVLVTAIQQEAGQSPCWGLGEFNKQLNQWLFTERECKYLGGSSGSALFTDACGNTVDVGLAYSPRKMNCSKGQISHYEMRHKYIPGYTTQDSKGWATYHEAFNGEVNTEIIDQEAFNYSFGCAGRALYGPDSRRDIDNYEDYAARQKAITDRNNLLQYNLASCYDTGKLNAAGDDLEYTKSECDMLRGTYDTETKRCLNPFNKPKPHGTGCTDLDAVKSHIAGKEATIKDKLQTEGSFRKGNIALKIPYQSDWAKKWEDFSRFWGWNGMALWNIRDVDEWNTYNIGMTDEDVDAVKAKYPELVLWTAPPTAEQIAAELEAKIKTTYPEIYNRTTKLRQPLPDKVEMPIDYVNWEGRSLREINYVYPLSAEETAIIDDMMRRERELLATFPQEERYGGFMAQYSQEMLDSVKALRKQLKEERIARGDLVVNFGLWDDTTPRNQYNQDNLIPRSQADLCDLMGDTFDTAWDPSTCKAKDPKRNMGSLKNLFDGYERANKVYGVPGDYSFPFYVRMSQLRLFITSDEIEAYKKKFNTDPIKPRSALITPAPPPPPPAPILSPLEEAKKALTEATIISPPPPQIPFTIIDAPPKPEEKQIEIIETPPPPVVKPPETIQEHAKDVEGKIKQLDKTATDYTYYAVVGGLGLAAFFLVK